MKIIKRELDCKKPNASGGTFVEKVFDNGIIKLVVSVTATDPICGGGCSREINGGYETAISFGDGANWHQALEWELVIDGNYYVYQSIDGHASSPFNLILVPKELETSGV